MRNDAAALGCAAIVVGGLNIAFFCGMVALAAYVVKLVIS